MNIMMTQYIYLLQEREFIKTKEHVYKVGMTKKENHKRFNQYPKGSVLLFQMICNNCTNIEKIVLKKFKETFKQRRDIGNEYFEGDCNIMIDIIYLTIKDEEASELSNKYKLDMDDSTRTLNGIMELTDLVITYNPLDYIPVSNLKSVIELAIKQYKSIDTEMDKEFKRPVHVIKTLIKNYKLEKYKNRNRGCDDRDKECIFGIKIKNDDDEQCDIKDNEIEYNLLCEKICKIFPDYKNDESFGGNKKYIKISIIDNEYVVYYINPTLMNYLHKYYENECETRFDDYIINQYEINKNVADQLQYFNHLIKKLVRIDKIYDINSTDFITEINKTKFYINIENYDDFQSHLTNNKFYCKIIEKIRQLFHCNIVVNNCLYSTMVKEDETYDIFKKFKNLKDYDNFRIDVGIQDYNMIKLYKINSKYYDYKTFLRKYIPYVIRWDINNDYYIVNRDYEYIGLNSTYIDYIRKGQSYLFNDENNPWNNKNNYIRICNEYTKIIKDNSLKTCLNMHNSTATILTLLD
jgi:hypothetical protein